jgi:hypothetical protein
MHGFKPFITLFIKGENTHYCYLRKYLPMSFCCRILFPLPMKVNSTKDFKHIAVLFFYTQICFIEKNFDNKYIRIIAYTLYGLELLVRVKV